MYSPGYIDRVRECGETWAVDPELRDALDRLAADLRGEIRSGESETRTYIDTTAAETRRHFDVIAESLRGDIRSLAELMAISSERTDRGIDEQAGRTGGLEGRVLRLEARVLILEDGRKPRRPRRRR
jgi:hypothetical protein